MKYDMKCEIFKYDRMKDEGGKDEHKKKKKHS
jgi:hypothetical protein